MRGISADFAARVVQSHAAVCEVDVIQGGKVVAQLAVHAGSVTADRTAAQMRSFEVEVSDPTGALTPNGISALLAPFGTRLRLSRGVRLTDVVTVGTYSNNAATWAVSGPTGVMNGTVADGVTGALKLGP